MVRAAALALFLESRDPNAACKIETGVASYYGLGDGTAWHRTASGQRFDPWGMTAAHPSLPFGTSVRVLHMGNRRVVVVIVNDRGPARRLHRAIDLSAGAARQLGMLDAGLARVALIYDCNKMVSDVPIDSDDWTPRVAALIGREGRYSNDPADRGGETMWGITANVARAWGYTGPMREMPRSTACDIFSARYIAQPGWDRLAQVDRKIAVHCFDAGVNCGVAWPGHWLQRALNSLNRQGTDWADVTVDGVAGALTRYALIRCIAIRGDDGRRVVLGMLAAQQSVRYLEIAEETPSQETYEFGWQINRALGDIS